MAITGIEYRLFQRLREAGQLPAAPRVLELGQAHWVGDVPGERLRRDLRERVEEPRRTRLLDRLGELVRSRPPQLALQVAEIYWEMVLAPSRRRVVDLDGTPDALGCDLNQPLPLDERFDVVLDLGTAPGVFDLRQFFESVHDATAPGGLMIHAVPVQVWPGPGLVAFQPSLFFELARGNAYQLVSLDLATLDPLSLVSYADWRALAEATRAETLPPRPWLYCVLRKPHDRPFQVPALSRSARGAAAPAVRDDASHAGVARRVFQQPKVVESIEQQRAARRRLLDTLDQLEAAGARFEQPLRELMWPPGFRLSYHDQDNRAAHERIARFFDQTAPASAWRAAHCEPGAARRAGPLRLGICSMFLYDHTVGHLTRGLIAELAREELELSLIRPPIEPDPIADEIARHAHRLVTMRWGPPGASRAIAELELDVLLYPDLGMSLYSYLLARCRLAPVQCVTWGHPDTTGLASVDYFLSSVDLEPGPEADAHYTETLVRLGHLPVCYPRPPAPAAPLSRGALGLPDDANLYLCPHTSIKFHPEFDALLRGVLEQDPRGRIVMVVTTGAEDAAALMARLRSTMPAVVDRVQLLPWVPSDRFIAFLALADVVLDTRPFGSGRVAYECVAAAVPMVTWPGRFMRGRVVGALYRRMGLTELVTSGPEAYVQTAVRVATDRAWRAALVARIVAASGAVFDRTDAARELTAFFRQAVDDARRGARTRWTPWPAR